MGEWWTRPTALWGFLVLSAGVAGVLTYLSPRFGIPVCSGLIVLGIVLLVIAYRHRDRVAETINELKRTSVSVVDSRVDMISVLQLLKGLLATPVWKYSIAGVIGQKYTGGSNDKGIWDATESILVQLSLYGIIESEPHKHTNVRKQEWDEIYWKLTDFGKEVIRRLEKRQPASHAEGSQN